MSIFYNSGTVEKKSRSRMNAPFRIASPEGDQELEKKFIEEAAAKDMIQLKGHRSVCSLFVCSVLLLVSQY